MLPRLEVFFYRYLFPSASLVFLLFLAYVGLFEIPYMGFDYDANGLIVGLLPPEQPNAALQPGDQILSVDGVAFEAYDADDDLPLVVGTPGQVIELEIDRDGTTLDIFWELPEPHPSEISIRAFFYAIPLGIWLIGALTINFLRPMDQRWKLLISFNFLLAIWMLLGFVATGHIYHSAALMQATTWLLLPVALHLHWVFPQPLTDRSGFLRLLLYLAGAGLAMAEWFGLLPGPLYLAAFAVVLPTCGLLLWLHVRTQPGQRRNILLILSMVGMVLLPATLLVLINLVGIGPSSTPLFMVFVPLVPATYLIVGSRSEVGWLELRANRRFTIWVFALLLISTGIAGQALLQTRFFSPSLNVLLSALLFTGGGLFSAWAYPHFERWFSKRVLGVPPEPTQLAESYLSQMTANLERARLFELFRSEILDGLLIRQAVLIGLEHDETNRYGLKTRLLLQHGVRKAELPSQEEIAAAVHALQIDQAGEHAPAAGPLWVRQVLLARLSRKPALLCLLGRRDPDDQYAFTELPTLQALVEQTALALAHLDQASLLRKGFQQNIDRVESERMRTARILHDEVLTEMALLAQHLDENLAPQALVAYQASVQHIRGIIQGLRPNMMVAGLHGALQELADEAEEKWAPRGQPGCRFDFQVQEPAPVHYPPDITQHLFRIVEHACWNACKHGKPHIITISGLLEDRRAFIEINDDGCGFAAGERMDLSGLLAARHYGMASMHERAALIGAHLAIRSTPGQGTCVQVIWETPEMGG